jgi:hypothetical protein
MERAAHPGGASRWMRIGSDRAERDGIARPRKIFRPIQRGRCGVSAVGAAGDGKEPSGSGCRERRDERRRWDRRGRCGRCGERRDARNSANGQRSPGRWRNQILRPGSAVALRHGVSAVHVLERPPDSWSSRGISGRVSASAAARAHDEAAGQQCDTAATSRAAPTTTPRCLPLACVSRSSSPRSRSLAAVAHRSQTRPLRSSREADGQRVIKA